MILAGARVALLSVLAALLLAACGQDKMERGLPDHVDASTPADTEDLSMSEQQRRADEEEQVEDAEQKDFDDAESADEAH